MDKPRQPDKRQSIALISQLLGATTAAQLLTPVGIASAFAYTPQKGSESKDGSVFNQAHMMTLKSVCETILPKSHTPGAADLDVHGFIDHQLFYCHSHSEQAQCKALLKEIDRQAIKRYQQPFHLLDNSQALAQLTLFDNGHNDVASYTDHFTLLKGLTLTGFFTSEVGASEILHYAATPGGFRGSVKHNTPPRGEGCLGRF